jgi:hypothetical protein
MHGIGVSLAGGVEQRRNREVALTRIGGTDPDRLVRLSDVPRVDVRVRVDRHARDARLTAGADDAPRDLPAIRDEQAADRHQAQSGLRFCRKARMPS